MEERGIIKRIDRSFPAELKLVLRLAKDNGWWIYQRSNKRWYTPAEFQNEGYRLLQKGPDGRTNSDDFYAQNPWDGLRLRVDHLLKVADEISSFVQRMEAHYKSTGIFK